MEILRSRFENNTLHHAYVIVGDIESLASEVATFSVETLEIGLNHPDYYQKIFDTFGVDEAREIKELAYLAPFGSRRIFILGIPSITREAQNALLKLLEEPPKDVHFFLLAYSPEVFLPTVRSRVEVITMKSQETLDVSSFLSAKIDARLEMGKKLADEKDKAKAVAFLSSLEATIHQGKGSSEAKKQSLEAVLLAERYIRDPGSSVKQLLEYVALALP